MQTAQITSLAPHGTWQSQHGTMYSWSLTLSDGTIGEANTKSQNPPYRVGDTVGYDITGEHQGVPRLKITKNPQQSGGGYQQRQNPPQNNFQPPPQHQTHSAPQNTSTGQGSASVNGATVGMALKAAVDLERHNHPNDPVALDAVFATASDLIRLAWKLEHGKLAPKTGERQQAPVQQQQPAPAQQQPYASAPAQRPQPGPGGSVALDEGDEDVPF